MPPLDSIQRQCATPITITSFYYSANRKSIYIKCNQPGMIIVTNMLGSIARNYSYRANGQWINVGTLPSGAYLAATYGRSFYFIK
jgi:hypothetical protein